MGRNSAQGQILFQEVQENSVSPAQVEDQKDLLNGRRGIQQQADFGKTEFSPVGS